jgi:hypothetical protein
VIEPSPAPRATPVIPVTVTLSSPEVPSLKSGQSSVDPSAGNISKYVTAVDLVVALDPK